MSYHIIATVLLVWIQLVHADITKRISLSDYKWLVHNTNHSIAIEATVPGNIYTDLYTANIIDNPVKEYNELLYRWVAYENWTYSVVFDVDKYLPHGYYGIDLKFDGIDTISDIYFNNVHIGSTDNMHRNYTYDIIKLLQVQHNNLSVVLHSAVLYAQHQMQQYPYNLPLLDPELNLPYRNMIRKAQSDFGWDWGVGLAGRGIYKDVYIYAYWGIRFNNVVVQQIHQSPGLYEQSTNTKPLHALSDIVVVVDVYVSTPVNIIVAGGDMILFIEGTNCKSIKPAAFYTRPDDPREYDNQPIDHHVQISCRITTKPLLWYTHMLGTPYLYNLSVTYVGRSGDALHKQQIGFRHIVLVQEQLSDTDTSFYFRLNGVPLFIKGANVIPTDVYHTHSTQQIDSLIQAALFGHMNMLRVWGGGVYMQDRFYELCDQYGILVWQEYAFACATYPTNTQYLNTVTIEIQQQTRRIASHTSVVVFGGNNENEAAILGWYEHDINTSNIDLYEHDYMTLYIDTIYNTLQHVLSYNQHIWLDSSPSKGTVSTQPYVKKWSDVTSIQSGDIHWYNYTIDCNNVDDIPLGKFVSEFGWQSYSSIYAWLDTTDNMDNLSIDSEFTRYRQRHANGNTEIEQQIRLHYRWPNNSNKLQQFTDYIYITQLQQSQCYRNAIQYWRVHKHTVPTNTMGLLYWQLNDIWTAPTWSSIESTGRYKLLHYTIHDVYAPVILASWIQQSDQRLQSYIVSDVVQQFKALVTLSVYTYTNSILLYQLSTDLYVDSLGVQQIVEFDKFVSSFTDYHTNEVFYMISATTDIDVTIQSITVYPTPLKYVTLPDVEITKYIKYNEQNNIVDVTLIASNTALHVFVQTPIDGRWSENGFTLLTQQPHTIQFQPSKPLVDVDCFVESLDITSVRDTYL